MADKKKISLVAELRAMDNAALATKIADLRKELVEQHRANKAGELPSTAALHKTRKSIAKAMTVLAEKATQPEAQKEEGK